MLDTNTRAPKQLGDFGEGLVTYALIRKGFEVACVDHVGADLICEKNGHRIAVSVKTRMFRSGSVESHDFSLGYDHVEKLEYFASRFGLIPVLAHAACIADKGIIHLFMFMISDAKRYLKRGKHGYRLAARGITHAL